MKLDRDFKREFDSEFSEGSYMVKKFILKYVVWTIVLFIVFGAVGIGWKYVKTNSDRVIFKQSTTYNEGVLDDLAKYKFEYDTAEDSVEREAIASLVRNRFANYDKSKIENRELLYFLKECGL